MSGTTSLEGCTTGAKYCTVMGTQERRELKAPRLNFRMWVLFEVVPSGKIIRGELTILPSSIKA